MKILLFSLFQVLLFITPAFSEIRPDAIHLADAQKKKKYVHDGLITGGDRTINGAIVENIRHTVNQKDGYDRIVIDVSGSRNGEPTAIPRPPYYQIAVTPDERRLIVSIWGSPRLLFKAPEVVRALSRGPVIDRVALLPRIEDDRWTFQIELKGDSPVEAFELSSGARIIIDIQHPRGQAETPES